MRKKAFNKRKNTLTILLVFLVLTLIIATAVSATE